MKKETAASLAEHLRRTDFENMRAVVGFDGFVDEVVHVVDRRLDTDHYERVGYLADYGRKFLEAAGLSLNVEMVPVARKMGGNGPIFANSLSKLGMNLTYMGALGREGIHLVFQELEERAHLISLSDPAFTDAVEFYDGKVISSKLEAFRALTWENIKKQIPVEIFAGMMDESALVGFENWTMLVHMTKIWKGICGEVFPLMKNPARRKMFLDLADPAKRTEEDILEAIDCMRLFETRFEVILGLNEKEAFGLAALFGKGREDFGLILSLAEYLKEKLPVSVVVVHPVKEACAVSREGSFCVQGPYCEKPKLTTGAGDNFNAGFVLGYLAGCSLKESLTLGTANSGYYVRHAHSADLPSLCQFLLDWSDGRL